MSKLLILIIGLTISCSGFCKDWVLAGETENSNYYIDMASISKVKKNIYKAWILSNKKQNLGVGSSVSAIQFDCSEKEFLKHQFLSTINYPGLDATGKSLSQSGTGAPELSPPDSVSEILGKAICLIGLAKEDK